MVKGLVQVPFEAGYRLRILLLPFPGLKAHHFYRHQLLPHYGRLGRSSRTAYYPSQPNAAAVAREGVAIEARGLAGRLDPVGYLPG